MYSWDTTTFELTETRLRLKSGLRFAVQKSRHGSWYMIEDESRGSFFRLGPAEYTFLSYLDGQTTLATAMARTCSLMGASALDENEAIQLCKWLVETGLANTDASVSAARIEDEQQRVAKQKTIQKLNPISIRFPLWNPDKQVTLLTTLVGWMVSWPFALVWLFVCCYALISVAMDWERLLYGSAEIFTRDGAIWMVGTWLVLKVVHEASHAIVCKKFGGKTGDFGILMLLMIPLPYVDVTSSWRFTNKYQRILVAAAGMLAEMFIAAIAAIIWCHSGPGVVSFYASTVIFAASLHTLLFNANPLLKFDGYHILADWLELPNLGSHGQRYVMGIGKKLFFGLPAEKVKYAGIHGLIIKSYGFAALLWRISLCLILGIAAANLFQGIGLIIALAAAVLWLILPVFKFVKYLVTGTDIERPERIRFARNAGLLTGFLTLAMLVTPAPSVITAPMVVEYDDLCIVRNESAGFIESISVQRDQMVKQGDLLLVVRNPDLKTQRLSIEIELQEARVRANTQQSAGQIGALQIEMESIAALEKQLMEIRELDASLYVRAPQDGRVIASELDGLIGSFVTAGTELLSIGNDDKKSGVALIPQDNAKHLGDIRGKQVDVRLWGKSGIEQAEVLDVNPRGQDDLPHFSFAGMYGGPLEVANRRQLEKSGDPNEDESENLMLINARVKARLRFDAAASERLHSGQTGLIHLRSRSGNLGRYLFNGLRRWFSRNMNMNHGI